MIRPTLAELELRCQKPDHRRIGNWMARRVARPLALRITWVLLPAGITAHAVTLIAWLVGLCSVAAFAWGNAPGWLVGALLLQAWYVLDHVDGQLARYRDTASLDGVQLDYLMHHSLNLLLPIGIGSGLAIARLDPLWALCGLVWGVALLMIGLLHDTRYKAFIQRLKRVQGELLVLGGGGARPEPQPSMPRHPARLAAWLLRKACEMHVIMNVLIGLALAQINWPQAGSILALSYLCGMAIASAVLLMALLVKGQTHQAAEREFARWFRPPPEQTLVFRDGWWFVDPADQ
jgi:hypothetical protein